MPTKRDRFAHVGTPAAVEAVPAESVDQFDVPYQDTVQLNVNVGPALWKALRLKALEEGVPVTVALRRVVQACADSKSGSRPGGRSVQTHVRLVVKAFAFELLHSVADALVNGLLNLDHLLYGDVAGAGHGELPAERGPEHDLPLALDQADLDLGDVEAEDQFVVLDEDAAGAGLGGWVGRLGHGLFCISRNR